MPNVVAIAERERAQRVEITANPHALACHEIVGFVHDSEVGTRVASGARTHLAVAADDAPQRMTPRMPSASTRRYR